MSRRDKHSVRFRGKLISVKQLAEGFGVPYDSCLRRWHQGVRDPWKILFGEGGKPVEFKVTPEQIEVLQETRYYRRGQEATKGSGGHRDSEWTIACDLIGIPRIFSEDLKEALCSKE